MQILGPHHTSTESESAFDQDHEVICMHTQAPESPQRCLFPVHQLKQQDSRSLRDSKTTIKGTEFPE